MERAELSGEILYAYAAGIIDGEGSIDIYRVSRKGKNPRYSTRLVVGMTDPWIPKLLQNHFGGSVYVIKHGDTQNWKDTWFWSIQARKAENTLRLILPYLQIKQRHAELALSFQSRKFRRHKPLSEEEMALEEADRLLMHSYNRRGKEV